MSKGSSFSVEDGRIYLTAREVAFRDELKGLVENVGIVHYGPIAFVTPSLETIEDSDCAHQLF